MSEPSSTPNIAGAIPLVNWDMLKDLTILEQCRNALRDDGAMVLRNFATQEGLNHLKTEVLSCPYNESQQHYTPWQDQGDHDCYSLTHPRNYLLTSSAAFVSRKTLERTKERLGISIYDDDRIIQFLSQVAGRMLYRSTDDNGSVYSYRVHSNHNAPWHFDESPYTAIVYLQNGETGGEFEYVPWCRPTKSKDDVEGHNVVRHVLMEGRTERVKRIVAEPGTLIFFSGAHSFHRAAPISGPTARVGLVFTFGESKGFENSKDVKDANEWDPDNKRLLE